MPKSFTTLLIMEMEPGRGMPASRNESRRSNNEVIEERITTRLTLFRSLPRRRDVGPFPGNELPSILPVPIPQLSHISAVGPR